MVYFVYLLTFANGKIYVGMSKTDKNGAYTNRYRAHAGAAKTGKALPVYRAWRKHGAPAQTVFSKHPTREDCAAAEIRAIAALNATDPGMGYNLMPGGEGMHAPKGSVMHALMNEKVWNNPARIAKVSAALKGKPVSPETQSAAVAEKASPEGRERMRKTVWENETVRAKLSAATTLQMANGGAEHIAAIRRAQGDTSTPDGRARQTEKIRAFMNTPEGKAVARCGREVMLSNPENAAKFEAGRAAWRNSEQNAEHCKVMAQKSAAACSKPVTDNATGVTYGSQREAALALGVSEAAISKRVKSGKFAKP